MSRTSISSVRARRVWDSRGNPTVEAEIELDGGAIGRAIAPAGASRGSREAVDLRDGGPKLRGLGVGKAVASVNDVIAPALRGREIEDQAALDAIIIGLDASPQKATLGGNATVAVSLALLHAAAAATDAPLWRHIADHYNRTPSVPLPEIQIFGGGAHAGRRVDVQDFMVMVPGAKSFDEALEVTHEIYAAAGRIMKDKGRLAGIADEGGWWPVFDSNEEALEILMEAIRAAGEVPGERVIISLDIAASEFSSNGRYRLALEERSLDSAALVKMLGQWLDRYPIASIEDPVSEDDVDGMRTFTAQFGSRVQIIGDDFLVTNSKLVREAINNNSCNAVLIKVNQAGTVSEAVDALLAAESAGWRGVVSARSGETEDTSITHLAVGLGAGQLKVGSFARSERMAKWNEALRIEEELGAGAFVAGSPMANTWWGKRHKSA